MKKKKDIIDALERDAAGRISTNDYDEVPREEASKIRKLIRQAALPKTVVISCRSYILGRIAIVLSCALLAGCISVYAFPIMVDMRLDHAISQKGSIIAFHTPDHNLVLPETELLVPSYVPAGYTAETYAVKAPYSVVYQNEENQVISLIQSTEKTGGLLDNSETTSAIIKIFGEDAELLNRQDGSVRLLWAYNGFYFTLDASALPESELVKIAESIK